MRYLDVIRDYLDNNTSMNDKQKEHVFNALSKYENELSDDYEYNETYPLTAYIRVVVYKKKNRTVKGWFKDIFGRYKQSHTVFCKHHRILVSFCNNDLRIEEEFHRNITGDKSC